MSNSELIGQLLDKLILEAHQAKFQWLAIPKYFETNKNEPLRRFIIENNKYAYSETHSRRTFSNSVPLISEYRSRCISIDGGVITLFMFQESPDVKYALAIQPSDTAGVTILECDGNQTARLNELAEIIGNEQYEVMRFINRIIGKN